MIKCKNCSESDVVKNGKVREKQRYKCKVCSYIFVEGDGRAKHNATVKRAFAVILYSLGKASYGLIAKLFGVTPSAVLKWIRKEADLLDEPRKSSEIKNIEFDEMWHFIQKKQAVDHQGSGS